MSNVISAQAGNHHTLAVTECGTLWTWGDNDSGQLGDGTVIQSSIPMRIMDNISDVFAGEAHSHVITKCGDLWGWGANSYGQLGNGTLVNSDIPIYIKDNVITASTAYGSTLAITYDGVLWSWGGKDAVYNIPLRVMDDVIAASTREGRYLAVTKDGTVWTWGRYLAAHFLRHIIVYENQPIPIPIMNADSFIPDNLVITGRWGLIESTEIPHNQLSTSGANLIDYVFHGDNRLYIEILDPEGKVLLSREKYNWEFDSYGRLIMDNGIENNILYAAISHNASSIGTNNLLTISTNGFSKTFVRVGAE